MPGDSPMGYRLPLDSLPWAAAGDQQQLITQDPFESLRPCPHAAALRAQFGSRPGYDAHRVGGGFAEGGRVAVQAQPWPGEGEAWASARPRGTAASAPGRTCAETAPARDPDTPARRFESAGWLTRTALCVEVRDPQRANGPKAEKRAWRQERRALRLHAAAEARWRTTSNCSPRSRPPPPSWA